MYLNDLNFYLDMADLYARFDTDFVFLKTKKYNYHQFFSIYYSFPFHIHYHYIGCQLYPRVSTSTDDHMNKIVKKRQ